MISKEDQAIVNKFRSGKWITLGADLFGSLLLFYLYSVNSNEVFLWMALLLLVVGAVFVFIMGRAEKKFIETVRKNAGNSPQPE
jgi:hypothetical protein